MRGWRVCARIDFDLGKYFLLFADLQDAVVVGVAVDFHVDAVAIGIGLIEGEADVVVGGGEIEVIDADAWVGDGGA